MQTPTLAQLRKACWPLHQRLEKRLDVPRRFGSPGPYREHLEKMWGFCAALEPHIARSALGEALPDYESRRKLPVLTRDLHALGLATETLQRVPRCEDVPMCEDMAAAFGCVYVLEGATLGGQVLLPMVKRHLGLTS